MGAPTLRTIATRCALWALALSCVPACQKQTDKEIERPDEDRPRKKKQQPDPKTKPPTAAPKKHRAAAEPCPRETKTTTFGPRMKVPDGPPCKANADCKEEKNGRCSASGTCTYDNCYVDGDCKAAGSSVCVCREEGRNGYFCLAGNCATDSDCGKDGFCSPTYGMQCGPFTGTIGWYCHTAKDECVDDEDCRADSGRGYCAYSPELGLWKCGYGMCVG